MTSKEKWVCIFLVTELMMSKEKWVWSIAKVREVLELGIKFTDNSPTKKGTVSSFQLSFYRICY